MTLKDLRTVADPYGKIDIIDADSCITLACSDEENRLIDDYDEYPVDIVIPTDCTLRVYVYEQSTEPGVSF